MAKDNNIETIISSEQENKDMNVNNKVVLQTDKLTKKFGGLIAVNNFDLKVSEGEISSLIGPNGAGKTTVFNVVTGIYKADGGKVIFKGEDLANKKPHQIIKRGIARTFQNIRLFSKYDLSGKCYGWSALSKQGRNLVFYFTDSRPKKRGIGNQEKC